MTGDERGAQGEAGVAGRQGEAGVAGGEGRPGRTGVVGERGPRGPAARLRWAPAVGYVLLALVLGFLIFRVQTTCVDTRASFALRHQWARVEAIIDATQSKKPGERGYIPPKEASRLFAESYRQALEEAGPAPACRGLLP